MAVRACVAIPVRVRDELRSATLTARPSRVARAFTGRGRIRRNVRPIVSMASVAGWSARRGSGSSTASAKVGSAFPDVQPMEINIVLARRMQSLTLALIKNRFLRTVMIFSYDCFSCYQVVIVSVRG